MKKTALILAALLLGASLMAFSGCSGDNGETKEQVKNENIENTGDASAPDTSYKKLYLETVSELESRYEGVEDVEWTYGLVDIDGNATPELVAGYPGSVSLYTVSDSSIYTVMEEFSVGAFGINGYSYLPGKNVIFQEDQDMAGIVVYETYCKIGEYSNFENIYAKPLYTSSWVDENGDGMPDENEVGKELKYFYGTEELTKEEYESYRFGDGFLPLFGEMTYDEITAELSK